MSNDPISKWANEAQKKENLRYEQNKINKKNK